jgi:hypothetical protein
MPFLSVGIGYLRITDLGIARIWKPENSSDTSGTPGYMGTLYNKSQIKWNIFINVVLLRYFLAPEVMCR